MMIYIINKHLNKYLSILYKYYYSTFSFDKIRFLNSYINRIKNDLLDCFKLVFLPTLHSTLRSMPFYLFII